MATVRDDVGVFHPLGWAVRGVSPPVEKPYSLSREETADPSTPLRSGRDDKGRIGGEGER